MNSADGGRACISAPIVAGVGYFVVVFLAGFALGTARVLLIAPRLGEGVAVALELPLMLAVSWIACGWAIGRWRVRGRTPERGIMGALAFLLLMAAELALALAFGRSFAQHLAAYATGPDALGLAGQIAFAVFPLLRR